MPKGTKVPAGVAVKQVVFLINWKVAEMAVLEISKLEVRGQWFKKKKKKITHCDKTMVKVKKSCTCVVDGEMKNEHVTRGKTGNRVGDSR